MISHQDKKGVAAEIQTLEPGKKPEDIIRDPYVLELLGLEQNASFYESELEQALIDHLQKFLLEWQRIIKKYCKNTDLCQVNGK